MPEREIHSTSAAERDADGAGGLGLKSEAIHGAIESITPTWGGFTVCGWAQSKNTPHANLDFVATNAVVASTECRQFRFNAFTAGLDQHFNGFTVFIEHRLLGANGTTIAVVDRNSRQECGQFELVPISEHHRTTLYDGLSWNIDSVDSKVRGWFKVDSSSVCDALVIAFDSDVIDVFLPDKYRPDVEPRRYHALTGFERIIPSRIRDGQRRTLQIYCVLNGSTILLHQDLYRRDDRPLRLRNAISPLKVRASSKAAIIASHPRNQNDDINLSVIVSEVVDRGFDAYVVRADERQSAKQDGVWSLPQVTVVRRPNVGWDFGSWADVLLNSELLRERRCQNLLLLNDSIVPLSGFKEHLDSSFAGNDVWGLVSSQEQTEHLQSFCLGFTLNAKVAEMLSDFLGSLSFTNSRELVIERGELRLLTQVKEADLSWGALFPYEVIVDHFLSRIEFYESEIIAEDGRLSNRQSGRIEELNSTLRAIYRGVALNPTHFFARQIVELGAGFLKRDLVQKNPKELDLSWMRRILSGVNRDRVRNLAPHLVHSVSGPSESRHPVQNSDVGCRGSWVDW